MPMSVLKIAAETSLGIAGGVAGVTRGVFQSVHSHEEFKCSKTMSGYKLYYFPGRGRGEASRLSFAAANIEFEDIRLAGEAWAKEKACR